MASPPRERVLFGPFELDAAERLLLRDGRPVALPPKALDVLIILAERRGQLVTKDELLNGAWAGVVVEENVLSVAISRLRNALGEEFRSSIQAVPGYGYRLVEVADPRGDGLAGTLAREGTTPIEADELIATLAAHGTAANADRVRPTSVVGRPWLMAGAVGGLLAVAVVGPWVREHVGQPPEASAGVPSETAGEALAAYARGRGLWESRGFNVMAEALTHFKRAATLDPDFAPAYAGQALVYAMGYRTGGEAEAAAARALALDPSLTEAWAARGFARAFQDRNWEGARQAFDRALALDAHNVTTLQWYASFLMAQRRLEEAEAALEEAIRQQPEYAVLHADLCEVRYYRRDVAGAHAACDRALALDPAQPFVANHRAWLELGGSDGVAIARRRLELATHDFSAATRARLHARIGQPDSALAYVQRAVDDGVLIAPFLRPDPLFDPYRDDPRWIAAMRDMGLGP